MAITCIALQKSSGLILTTKSFEDGFVRNIIRPVCIYSDDITFLTDHYHKFSIQKEKAPGADVSTQGSFS